MNKNKKKTRTNSEYNLHLNCRIAACWCNPRQTFRVDCRCGHLVGAGGATPGMRCVLIVTVEEKRGKVATLSPWYFTFQLPCGWEGQAWLLSAPCTVRSHGLGLSSSAGLAKCLADIIEKRDAIHAAVDKELEGFALRLRQRLRGKLKSWR